MADGSARSIFILRLMCQVSLENPKPQNVQGTLKLLDEQGHEFSYQTYTFLLRMCGNTKDLRGGQKIHEHMVQFGRLHNTCLVNLLVEMYGKCGALETARSVFDNIQVRNSFSYNIMIAACIQCGCLEDALKVFNSTPKPDIVSWTSIISGYARNGCGKEALHFFRQMKDSIEPNRVTFISILGAFADQKGLAEAKFIHSQLLDARFDLDVVLGTALLNMYGQCGHIQVARQLFWSLHEKNLATWNAMVGAYAQNGYGTEALNLMQKMQWEGMEPDRITFLAILGSRSDITKLAEVKVIHAASVTHHLESCLGSALAGMYSRWGNSESACLVFDRICEKNVSDWNSMISSYVQSGQHKKGLQLFYYMQREDVEPSRVTYICALGTCSHQDSLQEGRMIHSSILEYGLASDVILGTALVSMYGKCADLEASCAVFEIIVPKSIVVWNAVIAASIQNQDYEAALDLFLEMQQEEIEPDKVTFLIIMEACADLGGLTKGRLVHSISIGKRLQLDVAVQTALVSMYGKCGSPESAEAVFDKMTTKSVVSWGAMLAAHAQNAQVEQTLEFFQEMHLESINVDDIIFVSLLSAFSHAGFVCECHHYFVCMPNDYNLPVTAEHCGCLVDVLGRVNWLEEAEDLLSNVPLWPTAGTWTALLGACSRRHVCSSG